MLQIGPKFTCKLNESHADKPFFLFFIFFIDSIVNSSEHIFIQNIWYAPGWIRPPQNDIYLFIIFFFFYPKQNILSGKL
jgi:hypothetical protein